MKNNKHTSNIMGSILLLFLAMVFTSCVSKTIIDSVPSKAKVYIDNQYVGQTPYNHSDKKIAGTQRIIKLVKEGYKDKKVILARDSLAAGPLVGGIFGTLFVFPVAGYLFCGYKNMMISIRMS